MATPFSISSSTEDVLDIDKTYELCKAINLVANVKDNSYQQLIQGLRQMVCDRLEYRKQMQFSQERQSVSVSTTLVL